MKNYCKHLFFLFLTFSSPFLFASEKPYIISGFDDVLRQADNTSLWNVAIKFLEKDKTYSGMPELYKLIVKKDSKPEFSLVSAISSIFTSRVDKFLLESKYPHHENYLRSWLREWSIKEFKIRKINEVLKRNPHKKFIVIFDNSDASIELAIWLKGNLPNRIIDIYLRNVVEKSSVEGVVSFFTAFDIAVNEFYSSRLSLDEVKIVGETVLNEFNVENILPSYGICPLDYVPCKHDMKEIKIICEDVQKHIRNLCLKN